jgi:hypothetical protein
MSQCYEMEMKEVLGSIYKVVDHFVVSKYIL